MLQRSQGSRPNWCWDMLCLAQGLFSWVQTLGLSGVEAEHKLEWEDKLRVRDHYTHLTRCPSADGYRIMVTTLCPVGKTITWGSHDYKFSCRDPEVLSCTQDRLPLSESCNICSAAFVVVTFSWPINLEWLNKIWRVHSMGINTKLPLSPLHSK